MLKVTTVCLLLLLLVGCRPPQPALTTAPSTPQAAATATRFTTTVPTVTPEPTAAPTATSEPTAAPTFTALPSPTTAPALTPPMTREVAYAYHSITAQLVAFGGLDLAGSCSPCSETWVWQDKQWSKREPAHAPPARSNTVMAYDASRKVIVLFGGATQQQDFNDTWLWDGQDWTQVHTAAAPSPRSNARMAFDAAHEQVVLWGGWAENADRSDYIFLHDTWTWDGKKWTEHSGPGPENGAIPPASMAYDGNLRQVVLWQFGTGLWTWNGSAWHKQTVNGPDLFTQGQIGFDETRSHSRLVLRGTTISGPSDSAKTWTFDGANWTLAADETGTDGYYQDALMVYDSADQLLLYLAPSGGKFTPSRLVMLAWTSSSWVDATH